MRDYGRIYREYLVVMLVLVAFLFTRCMRQPFDRSYVVALVGLIES